MTSKGRWILAATILGSSMAMIDGTVVNIALPALQEQMGATIADVQWVVEAYTLFLAALMLTGGAMGDRYGRKRVFCIGAVLFSLASLACGFAPTMSVLIASRAVQGVGAAMLVPGSLALISACFPDEERGKAIGTWSAFTSITMSIGPLVGGALIDYASWRAIFFINIPIAAIVLWLSWRHVPESRAPEQRKLDVTGAALATLGLGALVYGLIEASRLGFADVRIMSSLCAGVVLLGAFTMVEWKCRDPMLPLSLFASRAFSGANILTLFLYGALAGGLFFVPMNLILLQGFSATQAGAAMLPSVLILFALSRWSGGLVDRIGARGPLVAGPAIAAVGFALFMVAGAQANYWTTFFPAAVVLGFGMALTVAPLTTTVMTSVDRSRSGVASGVNNALAETAGVLAIAVFGLVMAHVFGRELDDRLRAAATTADVRAQIEAQRTKLAAIEIPADAAGPQRESAKAAIAASFVHGFRCVMAIAAAMAFLSAVFAWLSIPAGTSVMGSVRRRGR